MTTNKQRHPVPAARPKKPPMTTPLLKENEGVQKHRTQQIHSILKTIYPTVSPPLTHSNPFELLVAVILSAQTTDKMVNTVTPNLFNKYRNMDDYANAYLETFQKDIQSIGLYRNKGKNILAAAKMIKEKHNGIVPKTMEELVQLPGVGRKTASVVLYQAFGINEGIPIDTHMIRLTQALGLTKEKDPKKIELDLMKIVPQKEWGDFALRLIFYGREYWQARQKEHTGPLAEFSMV